MKKHYINPRIEVVNITLTQHVLSASLYNPDTGYTLTGGSGGGDELIGNGEDEL